MTEIQQTGDCFIVAKGEFTNDIIEKAWMPIKKGVLSIPKSVVMTHNFRPSDTDSGAGTTTFNFVVATNVVEQAIADGKVVGVYTEPLHSGMEALHQVLLNEATTAFADRLVELGGPNRPQEPDTTRTTICEGFAYA